MYLFVDTEFTDFVNTQLISVGLVSEEGIDEFYREVNDHNPNMRSAFVQQVVMPLCDMAKHGKPLNEVAADLRDWIDSLPSEKLTIVYDYTGDYQLLHMLFKIAQPSKPMHHVMLNAGLQEALFARGYITSDQKLIDAFQGLTDGLASYYNIDPRQHHALVDAKSNRNGWITAMERCK